MSRPAPALPLRVLFVEDVEDDALLLLRRLRTGGFDPKYRIVASGEELEAALGDETWDLVFLDHNLPGFSAEGALSLLTAADVDAPTFIVSGVLEEESAAHFMERGVADVLEKDHLSRLVPAVKRELLDAQVRRARRAMMEELRGSEQRFRQLTENIDDVFWVSSPEKDRIRYVSPAFQKIWGLPGDDLLEDSRLWLRAIHPEDRSRVEGALPDQLTGDYEEEYRIVRPDGAVRWILDRAFPVHDQEGQVTHIVGVAQDVTKAHQAAEAVRHAEERYRALVENATDVITVLDASGRIKFSSVSSRSLLGYEASELAGRGPAEVVHPDDRDRVEARIQELIDDPEMVLRDTYRVVSKTGKVMHVESVARNLLHLPAVEGLVINSRDITHRVELEAQLRQSQKMEAVGTLAGGVAHDFNNLLTVIEGHAALLLADLPPASALIEHVEEIQGSTRRAASLTRQLLAFSKRQLLQPQVLNPNEVVREMGKLLRRLIGEDLELVVELDPEVGMVRADPGQLQQVVLNLVVNSREALRDGGRIEIRTGKAPVPEEGSGPSCFLSVKDNGPGIPAEIQDRVFEPFFTTKLQGTGLGLSTVLGIVEQSGGELHLESAPGVGTIITVTLPEVSEQTSLPRESDPVPTKVGGGETILLVEDDTGLRSVVVRILNRLGYRVLEAPHGLEALEVAATEERRIDLLLTDVVLPWMNGRELAERMKSKYPDMRILLMSGYAEETVLGHGELDPSISFLAKPFSLDLLGKTVREVLDRS